MLVQQFVQGNTRVTPVDTLIGTAISDIVLGSRQDLCVVSVEFRGIALNPLDDSLCVSGDKC